MWRVLSLVCVVLLGAAEAGAAADVELSGAEGHPRARFPLSVYLEPSGDAALDAAARKAITDWTMLSRSALGVFVFTEARSPDAAVVVTIERGDSSRLMGRTSIHADPTGMIVLPVRIVVAEPRTRGHTSAELVFYQVVAHELGHALGLAHAPDPRSVMCCTEGSIDFHDAAQRDAYVAGRRNPNLESVTPQLVEHYTRFWKRHP